MSKKTKGVSLIIIITIVCFILIDMLLNKWNILEHLTFFQKWEKEDINRIATVFNGILSFVIANVMSFLKLYLDNRKEIKREIPQISILVNNVTCIKKTKRKDGLLEVNMGQGAYFVYVNAVLKNTGESTIVECCINEKRLGIGSLTKEEGYNFCFKVCREKNASFKKSYVGRLKFRDDRGRCYEKIVDLEIDEQKREAKVISKGKQKKRRK